MSVTQRENLKNIEETHLNWHTRDFTNTPKRFVEKVAKLHLRGTHSHIHTFTDFAALLLHTLRRNKTHTHLHFEGTLKMVCISKTSENVPKSMLCSTPLYFGFHYALKCSILLDVFFESFEIIKYFHGPPLKMSLFYLKEMFVWHKWTNTCTVLALAINLCENNMPNTNENTNTLPLPLPLPLPLYSIH